MFICNTSAQRESGHSATGRLLSNVGAILQVSTVLNMARCKYDRCLKAIFLHNKSTTDKITAVKITTDKSTTGCGESRLKNGKYISQGLHIWSYVPFIQPAGDVPLHLSYAVARIQHLPRVVVKNWPIMAIDFCSFLSFYISALQSTIMNVYK